MMFGNQTRDERSFERALVASARHDPGPGDTEAAWTELAGSIGEASRAVAYDAHRANPGELNAGPRPPAHPAAGAVFRSAGAKAGAYLLLGLVAGSAATAIVLRGQPPVPLATSMVPASSSVAMSTRPAATTHDSIGAHAEPAGANPPPRGSVHEPKLVRRTAGSVAPLGKSSAAPQERLSDQVRAVDTAMDALQAGALDEAVRLVNRFHVDFPHGVLAPDAELVAIEALAEARETSKLIQRAERFIEINPNDPHAARVRRLLVVARGD
jgi:TolA-binding protein